MANFFPETQPQAGRVVPVVDLPTDQPRRSTAPRQMAQVVLPLAAQLSNQIRDLAAAQSTTLSTLLLATFQVLLHRYTGQDELVVGIPLVRQDKTDLVLSWADFSAQPTFADFLAQVDQAIQATYTHEATAPVQTLFVFQPADPHNAGATWQQWQPELTLTVTEQAHTLSLTFEYRVDLFQAAPNAASWHCCRSTTAHLCLAHPPGGRAPSIAGRLERHGDRLCVRPMYSPSL
jgi:non-ribosomal peptide synthetase component F